MLGPTLKGSLVMLATADEDKSQTFLLFLECKRWRSDIKGLFLHRKDIICSLFLHS